MHPTRLSDLSEGELLRRLFPVYDTAKGGPADVVLGPGDDAAVLAAPSGAVVLTTDTMVRGRDWRDDWSSPHEVGHKAVVQNVADIAAMGATPTGLLVALAADPATEVDWALGHAALHSRFAEADLPSILNHHAASGGAGQAHTAGEDRSLTQGTSGWAALGGQSPVAADSEEVDR